MTAELRSRLQASLGAAYTLERELGGGGMSRVFVATETRLRRPVVVKVLSTEAAAGVSAERFEREIQLAASLQQANIVPLLSAGDTEGIPYYTMPFVEGESLRARLVKDGRLPIAECIGILRDVARALSYAHAHGVVHRDIKPDNILLSHGAAVVADFGIAKAISAARESPAAATLTQAGTSIGTPSYMAPEQVAGDPAADHRVDLYAFGCVAYELLAGRPPFVDPAPQKVFAAHITQPPQPIRELRPDTPAALATIVMRCLEKQSDDRPAGGDELLRSLESVATPSGGYVPDAAPPPVRPRWWRTPIAFVAGIIVLAVIAAIVIKGRGARDAGPQDSSIAVLPLLNLSGDSANNYFGEGLAEEITSALAKAGLHVIGRGSARGLAARGLDAREIARQLGVATVLQGTVQRAGDNVRISVTLNSGADGSVRWTQKYDRQFKDVFAVQDEIARSVASELKATLSLSTGATLVHTETADPEAHTLYLQGLYLWNRRTAPAIHQAIGLFEDAVRRDPKYARAHAGIALAYTVLPHYEDGSVDSLAVLARAAATRALDLDSTLAEAWTARAYVNTYHWKNAEAEADFVHAIRLDSTFATTRFWHALLLRHVGRMADGQREFDAARRLEPTSLIIMTAISQLLVADNRFDEAAAASRRVIALDSTYVLGYTSLGVALMMGGHANEAIQVLTRVVDQPGNSRQSETKGLFAFALAKAGRRAEARKIIGDLQKAMRVTVVPSGAVAAALMELGDRAAALATLRAAIDGHDPWLINYTRSSRYDRLRAEPAGKTMLEAIERP